MIFLVLSLILMQLHAVNYCSFFVRFDDMSIVKKILNKTTYLRKEHEKRSDARGYLADFEGFISLPSEPDCYKVSLGYLERFLFMADHKKIDNGSEEGTLKIERWDEGCGIFSGEYSIQNNDEKIKSGLFEWSGRGEIEKSWNNFSKFE